MFKHKRSILRGTFDTKEYRSRTPNHPFKTINAKTPPAEYGTLLLKHVAGFNIIYESILSSA